MHSPVWILRDRLPCRRRRGEECEVFVRDTKLSVSLGHVVHLVFSLLYVSSIH